MRGIRVFGGQESFAQLFAPVLDALAPLHWITGEQAFAYPPAWFEGADYDEATDRWVSGPIVEFERTVTPLWDGSSDYGFAAPPGLLPTYAEAVRDDWTSLFGFRDAVPDPLAWRKAYYDAKDRHAFVATHCEVVFLDVDGTYWDFYSVRPESLDACVAPLRARGLRVDAVTLADALL